MHLQIGSIIPLFVLSVHIPFLFLVFQTIGIYWNFGMINTENISIIYFPLNSFSITLVSTKKGIG